MSKPEMTLAEFREAISQNPETKAKLIAMIETEVTKNFAQTNARNEERMNANFCTQEEIDIVKEMNDDLLRPAIKQVVFEMLGVVLAEEPQHKQ
jgi:hypothetical protein